jgi:hypothetical protein
VRAAGALAMVTKMGMGTNGDNTDNGYGKEGGGHSTAAMRWAVQRTRPLVL